MPSLLAMLGRARLVEACSIRKFDGVCSPGILCPTSNPCIPFIRLLPPGYHPQTQGKIERYHRSMKAIVKLVNFYFPWELEQAIASFVDYYNQHRYHESLDNLTPSDVFLGRAQEVQTYRQQIKQQTFISRRQHNLVLNTYS